jgi:GNAT superfamily N-acetyltransferase
MDPFDAADCLFAFHRLLDRHALRLEGEGILATIKPGRSSAFPSENPNRVWLHAGSEIDQEDVADIEDAYAQAQVERYFGWVVPGGDAGEGIGSMLAARGWREYEGPEYLTLARRNGPMDIDTEFDIRVLDPADVRGDYAEALHDIQRNGPSADYFVQCAGSPGFIHFAAFDGDNPVASALALVSGDCAWLGFAGTRESHRGRGAQTALIAARVAYLHVHGIGWSMSETTSMLETSLGNLMKAGFTPMLAASVYESP